MYSKNINTPGDGQTSLLLEQSLDPGGSERSYFWRAKAYDGANDGDFTPPGPDGKPALQFPGNGGGMNWGSGAYDARRGLLVVTDIRNPQGVSLKPWKNPVGGMAPDRPAQSQGAVLYKAKNDWLIGPLFIPCLQPPNGVMSAIDLSTRKVVWQVPLGTARNSGPFGLGSRLLLPGQHNNPDRTYGRCATATRRQNRN